ncbi:MAG: hypothetical protein M0P33_03960 [Massilibacteroides sp.]|nr:hypothetical protein [Massilibacteroides sp.]
MPQARFAHKTFYPTSDGKNLSKFVTLIGLVLLMFVGGEPRKREEAPQG